MKTALDLLLPLTAALLTFLADPSHGARVLMATLGGTKSHKIPFLELGRALTRRGHSVTMMSAFPPDESPIPPAPQPAASTAGEAQGRRHRLYAAQSDVYGNSTGLPAVIAAVPWVGGVDNVVPKKEGFLRPPPPPSALEDHAATSLVEIAPPGFVQFVREFTDWDLLGRRVSGWDLGQLPEALQYAYESCSSFLGDPVTRRFIRDPSQNFDLVIADGAFPDCIVGFAHRYRVPFMYINTVGFHVAKFSRTGGPVPYAVTPFFSLPYTEDMTFIQRLYNTFLHVGISTMQVVFADVALQGIVREAFGSDVPNIVEHEKNVSFILQNGHASVSYARPYLPLVAEVACIHCKPAKPLPKELEEFISQGPEGFIYFSMGSSVKAANMSPSMKALFVEAFARLSPIRVLWKWEDVNTGGLPSNVKVSRWLPQQDILGHPKIRAFVTHGGLLSMFETVYHGVPVVTMPVFCDHDSNAAKAEMDGYAIKLELRELTADKLFDAIQRIMIEPEFRENVHHRSFLLRDQPETPLDRAVYWTEYVIRHGGAAHLRSPLRNLSLVQAYGLDVMAFFLLIAVVFLAAISVAGWFILPRLLAKVRPSKRMPTATVPSVRQLTKKKVH